MGAISGFFKQVSYIQGFLRQVVLQPGVFTCGGVTTRSSYFQGFTTWGCYIEKFYFQGYNIQGSYLQGLLHPRVLHVVVVTSGVSIRRLMNVDER